LNNSSVIETTKLLKDLEAKYGKISLVTGSMGELYYSKEKIFFTCEDDDKINCVEDIFVSPNLETLIVYFLVKDKNAYQLRDARFKNIYDQNMKRMINHYHKVLEPSVKHGLKVGGFEYERCVGYGSVIIKVKKHTISDMKEIQRIIEEETKLDYRLNRGKESWEAELVPLKDGLEKKPSVASVRLFKDTLVLFGPLDTTLIKPKEDTGLEWDDYEKKVAWKDAMTLTIREKYYGILVNFDPSNTSYKVELNYPVEIEKLRMACKALDESLKDK
jgi:hypothetical protein